MRYLLLSVLVVCVIGIMIIPIAYAIGTLPPGVKSPAPNFDSITSSYETILQLYESVGFPQKNYASISNLTFETGTSKTQLIFEIKNAKIISGEGQILATTGSGMGQSNLGGL